MFKYYCFHCNSRINDLDLLSGIHFSKQCPYCYDIRQVEESSFKGYLINKFNQFKDYIKWNFQKKP